MTVPLAGARPGASAEDVLAEAAALALAWSRLALPCYGSSGSMDADLEEFPEAQGPSYYNQLAHWPLLLLSQGILPGLDDPAERERFKVCALRNIAYMLSITGEDFQTPHYSRGRDWGRHVGEWSNYFLLRSLSVMEACNLGSRDDRERLQRSIHGATARIFAGFERTFGKAEHRCSAFPGNHAVWHALLCYEAGVRFGEDAWVALARDFFRRHVLPFQDNTGCWPEGGGIVVNYAMVTAQAVSMYAEQSGDEAALTALGQYLRFVQFFSFPDGSSPVVTDCRMRYSRRPMIFLPPSFMRTAAGQAECLRRIRGFAALLPGMSVQSVGVQGLAFFSLLPAFLAAHRQNVPAGLPERAVGGIPAARLESGPWTGFLSWQLTGETPNRFVLDAQNFVELHHSAAGYLVGGGNSKYMARFSTLRRRTSGRAYIPDAAECVRQSRGEAVARYRFGADIAEVRLTLAEEGAEIGFRMLHQTQVEDEYEGALLLPLGAGEAIRLGEGTVTVTPSALIEHRCAGGAAGAVRWRGLRFELPAGAQLSYPVVPHNPYRQDGLPAVEEYTARLALTLSGAEQVIRLCLDT